MGLFGNKNTPKLTPEEKAENFLKPFILPNEIVLKICTNGTSHFALTDKRIVGLDTISEFPKKIITAVPLSKITTVEVETGGLLNLSQEVTIYASSKKITVSLYDNNQTMEFYNKINSLIIA